MRRILALVVCLGSLGGGRQQQRPKARSNTGAIRKSQPAKSDYTEFTVPPRALKLRSDSIPLAK